MPYITQEERIRRAKVAILQAVVEKAGMSTGRARTYSVARARKFLRRAKATLAVLVRKRTGADPEAQEILEQIETLWP